MKKIIIFFISLFFIGWGLGCSEESEDVEQITTTDLEGTFEDQDIITSPPDFTTTNVTLSIFEEQLRIHIYVGITSTYDESGEKINEENVYYDVRLSINVYIRENNLIENISITDAGCQANIDIANDGDLSDEWVDCESVTIIFNELCITAGTCNNSGTFEVILKDSKGTLRGQFYAEEVRHDDY